MKQLFANNAKTTLASALGATSTALVVADGSTFPTPNAYEYFLCTLELGGLVEVVMITARTGNTLTIGGLLDVGQTVNGRGQEGTIAQGFAVGARVECRITKNTLVRMSTSLAATASVDLLVAPKDAFNSGYVTGTLDLFGSPVITNVKDQYTWRFLSHTSQVSSTATTGTTTSVTSASLVVSGVAAGKFLIQFTSGALTGMVRQVNSVTSNVVSWTTPTSVAPSTGDTFEILKSNASILFDVLAIGDDAVIMPLLLGGE